MNKRIMLSIWQRFLSLFLIDRSIYLYIVGILGVVFGLSLDWYSLPSRVFEGGEWAVTEEIPFSVYAIKSIAIFLTAAVIVFQFQGNVHMASKCLWLIVLSLIFLPIIMLLFEMDFQVKAKIIYRGMERVVQLIDQSHIHQLESFRWYQALSGSPLSLGQDSLMFDVEYLNAELLLPQNSAFIVPYVLGVSNEWLAFVNRGWPICLFSSALWLMGYYLNQSNSHKRFLKESGWMFLFSGILSLLLFMPYLISQYQFNKGEYYLAKNEHDLAFQAIASAMALDSSAHHSLDKISRLGHLMIENGCSTCLENNLYHVQSAVLRNNYQEAFDILERMNPSEVQYRGFPYWFSLVLNEYAMHLYNEGNLSSAIDLWKYSVQLLPENPFPYYGMALAYGKMKHFKQAADAMEGIYSVQTFLGHQSMSIYAQLCLYQMWDTYQKSDYSGAHQAYLRWLNP